MPPLNVGLTGNIGSGKSTVAELFTARGAALIDADALARDATQDPDVLQKIASTFGDQLIKKGELDRAGLAELVFNASAARARLNAIIHPWVARERAAQVTALTSQSSPPEIILHDVPLLFEVGLDTEMDRTVVVDAPLATRVARVTARSGLTSDDVHARDAAQMPLEEKVKRADFVIDNSGDPSELTGQVARVWRALLSREP